MDEDFKRLQRKLLDEEELTPDEYEYYLMLAEKYESEKIYGGQKQIPSQKLEEIKKKLLDMKKGEDDKKMRQSENKGTLIGGAVEGEWSIIVPYQLLLAGSALSHGAFRLYVAIASTVGRKQGKLEFWIDVEQCAYYLGVSIQQTWSYLKELIDAGLVYKVGRRQRPSGRGVYTEYKLVNPKEWWERQGKKIRNRKKEEKRGKYRNLDSNGEIIKNSL